MGYLNSYRFSGNYELPTDGLVLYLDAQEKTTIIGDPVEEWQDLSGRGNDFYSTGGAKPVQLVDGRLSFDGAHSYMDGKAVGNYRNNLTQSTFFCVFRTRSTAVQQIIYAVSYNDSNIVYMPIFRIMPGGFLYYLLGSGVGTYVAIMAPIEADKTYVVSGTWKRPEMSLYVNGAYIDTIDTATMLPGTLDSERIGCRNNNLQNFLDGEISALLWYNIELAWSDRIQVENFLKNRFL